MGFEAKIVLHSVSPGGRPVVSVAATYPRFIHSEIMTHRDRARNAASSRAIPWKRVKKGKEAKDGGSQHISDYVPNCMYSMVMTEPVIPIYLGVEQKGMQAGDELQGAEREEAIALIKEMRDFCVRGADRLSQLGLHKSICNRYVEPWMWITTLMTATEWRNFLRLRCHPAAERHFNLIANMIRDEIAKSTPQVLHPGNWHTPYIQPEDHDAVQSIIREYEPVTPDERRIETQSQLAALLIRKISTGRCARLSYLTHEGRRDIREDIRLANQLIYPTTANLDEDVLHASPLEHVCMAHSDVRHRSGPFVGYHQFRKDYPNENVEG